MPRPTRLAGAALRGLAAVGGLVVLANATLMLALFGPGEGAARLASDWRRIAVAHQLSENRVTIQAAFATTYGEDLRPEAGADAIRSHLAADLEAGEPALLDVILVRHILARFGAIDGRTVPPGVYLAAGPIGPDRWPGPLLTHYLIFPRHGYLLVVPHRQGDRWPEAYEATASLRGAFHRSGDENTLHGVVETYRPGAYDFPTPGEPLHDLVLLTRDPEETAKIAEGLGAFTRRLDESHLAYRLLRRNSNSALACYLAGAGLTEDVRRRLGSRLLLRLRLPGIVHTQSLPC
ncbi:hypothetical protein [Phenylobacterium sp.]|uniref:hypothetical protein n=1 Tax=Phenylobacterium sp. TaxID=1871053 RepID=UPI0035B07A2E